MMPGEKKKLAIQLTIIFILNMLIISAAQLA